MGAMVLAEATSLDPFQLLITQAGIAGIMLVLLMTGQLYTGKSVQRERDLAEAQLARQEAERTRVELESARRQAMIDTLLAIYHGEILPTLADYEKKLAPALANVVEVVRKMEWIIGEYERRGRGAEENSWRPTGTARGPDGPVTGDRD